MRTKTVKKASRVLVEKYYSKLTLDFDINKRVAEDVAVIQTKRLRNKIAGFTTVRHLLKMLNVNPKYRSDRHGELRLLHSIL